MTPGPTLLLRHWPAALCAAVAFAYTCGHLGWYLDTPLGSVPVLDERENLDLAEAIVSARLPAEPFYRAPGYALALAGLRCLGVPAGGLFATALLLGAGLHALNAALVASLARRWFGHAAALSAGLLAALHPVFVHFSTQALDATPALTFFLLGLNSLDIALACPGAISPWISASLCWAAATLLRPNYLLVWAVLPPLAFILSGTPRWRRPAAGAALAGVALFAASALWQWRICSDAGFLPWQGAYNLWAANQPGAHGRYYVQRVSLPPDAARTNPARAESLVLYQRETGLLPTDIAVMNAHWRGRFLAHVTGHPGQWLSLLARKIYALLNNWEQYNNKTFAFHQARSPWLLPNPLSWGVLLILGVAGAARLASASPGVARVLAVVAGACALSIVLFFASARFRLPLAALLAALSGGAVAAPGFWRHWPAKRKLMLSGSLLLAATGTFSNIGGVRDRAPFVQDHTLLARAAETAGDNATAWREAQSALDLQPTHPDALRLAVTAYFNQLLAGAATAADEPRWLETCRRLLTQPTDDAPELRVLAALAIWRSGDQAGARQIWRDMGDFPDALAVRRLVGDCTEMVLPSLRSAAATTRRRPLVRLALGWPEENSSSASNPTEENRLKKRLFDRLGP
ncbi:MAG: hypothetical protein PHQ04_07720 [Opitutaceae bacterium]|nr:hypothetical protein [Opitutaceae bacterium]